MKAETAVDFLFEIGCEEIPAGMLPGAILEFKAILEKYLSAYSLTTGSPVEVYGTPRRIVASCSSLLVSCSPDESRDVTGPPKSVAFDASGKPTRAAESFAQKMNISVERLATISTPKGDYLSARQVILGRLSKEILEEILPRAVAEIPWPRSMYWTGAKGLHFIRPIRWVVALLGGKTLRITLGDAVAENATTGHRFRAQKTGRIPALRDEGLRPETEKQFRAGASGGPRNQDRRGIASPGERSQAPHS